MDAYNNLTSVRSVFKNSLNKENINTFSRSDGHFSGHPLNDDHNCSSAAALPYDNPDFGFHVVSHRKGNCCGTSSNSKMVVPIDSYIGNNKNIKNKEYSVKGGDCVFRDPVSNGFDALASEVFETSISKFSTCI